jgi:hypothetical protein
MQPEQQIRAYPPDRVRSLNSLLGVRRELCRIYLDGKHGVRDVGEVSKLANILAILARVIEGAGYEEELEQLKQQVEALHAARGQNDAGLH